MERWKRGAGLEEGERQSLEKWMWSAALCPASWGRSELWGQHMRSHCTHDGAPSGAAFQISRDEAEVSCVVSTGSDFSLAFHCHPGTSPHPWEDGDWFVNSKRLTCLLSLILVAKTLDSFHVLPRAVLPCFLDTGYYIPICHGSVDEVSDGWGRALP